MKYSEFVASLAKRISVTLEKSGFRRVSDDLFVRLNKTHEINIISIQKHSSNSNVCLNFGVHYDFLPKVGSIEMGSYGLMELADCEIKVRITPNSSQKDFWWAIKPESIDEVAALIENSAEDFFDRYSMSGEISSIVPADLIDSFPEFLSSLTKVRACLVLAGIQEALKNFDAAADFARHGIKSAGMAVGPKKMLKDVLSRVGKN